MKKRSVVGIGLVALLLFLVFFRGGVIPQTLGWT